MTELEDEWATYHVAHPRVYELICKFASVAIAKGRKRYAIATIWELIRWHVDFELDEPEFKLPNNHRAYYARLWMQEHPDYPGFFTTATLRHLQLVRDRWGRDRTWDEMHGDEDAPELEL